MMVMMMMRMARTTPPMMSFILRFSHHIFLRTRLALVANELEAAYVQEASVYN